VEHRVIMGDTSRPEVWHQLSAIREEQWQHENGSSMGLARWAIDSGYATTEVYSWANAQHDSRLLVVKGYDASSVILGTPKALEMNRAGKKIKRSVRVWPVGVSIVKGETYRALRLELPTESEFEAHRKEGGSGYPPGFIHFPEIEEEFFQQLTAESLVTRTHKGFPVREWQKDRERNEALDCRVYARAAAASYGMDRFGEIHWRKLERIIKDRGGATAVNLPSKPSMKFRGENSGSDEGTMSVDNVTNISSSKLSSEKLPAEKMPQGKSSGKLPASRKPQRRIVGRIRSRW